jgi:addiction module HigA family antidote
MGLCSHIVHMAQYDSHHPGQVVRTLCLDAFGLNVTEGAARLGVTRQALNNLVNGKSGISPEMAVRLDRAFGGGAETWLGRQVAYDLGRVRSQIDMRTITPVIPRINQLANAEAG